MIASLMTALLAATSPCTAAELHEGKGGLQGGTGSMLGVVLVRNVSRDRCALGGRPRVELLNAAGRVLVTRERVFALGNTGNRAVTTLAPHRAALLYVDWSNWCGSWSGPAGSLRKVWLRTTLTNGSRLTLWVVTGRPRCDFQTASSLLYVSEFTTT